MEEAYTNGGDNSANIVLMASQISLLLDILSSISSGLGSEIVLGKSLDIGYFSEHCLGDTLRFW